MDAYIRNVANSSYKGEKNEKDPSGYYCMGYFVRDTDRVRRAGQPYRHTDGNFPDDIHRNRRSHRYQYR
jgi:hypothetical protein